MSTFKVEVIEVNKVEKHPNADNLSITQVYGYPVIFRTGELRQADLAAYIPIDAIVPIDKPEFSFLKSPRIRSSKLRGLMSMGLLIKAKPGWVPGQDVTQELGVTKYEEKPYLNISGKGNSENTCIQGPGTIPLYTDVENYRRHTDILRPDELVCITEKIHGTNARYCYTGGQLWCGSHKTFKKEGTTLWWDIAKKYDIKNKLQYHSDLVFYGEIYGYGVQDMAYGLKEQKLSIFDIFDPVKRRFLDADEMRTVCAVVGLDAVPHIVTTAWHTGLLDLANGISLLNSPYREGIVIKAVPDRSDPIMGRVVLKQHSEEYLLKH